MTRFETKKCVACSFVEIVNLQELVSAAINVMQYNATLKMAIAANEKAAKNYFEGYREIPNAVHRNYTEADNRLTAICRVCGFDIQKVISMARMDESYMKRHDYAKSLDFTSAEAKRRWLDYILINDGKSAELSHMEDTHRLIIGWVAQKKN